MKYKLGELTLLGMVSGGIKPGDMLLIAGHGSKQKVLVTGLESGVALSKSSTLVESSNSHKGVRLFSKTDYFSSAYEPDEGAGSAALIRTTSYDPSLKVGINTEEDMEQALLKRMMDDLDTSVTLPKVKLNGPTAKWRVISGLQKAIRRGMVETAVKCALAMESFDSKYLWRRLMVIAVEDLGIPGLEIAALIGFLAGKEKFRQGLDKDGGKLILAYIVEQMAKLPKDRTFCELANGGHFHRTPELFAQCFDKTLDREVLLDKYMTATLVSGIDVATRFTYGLAVSGGLKRTIKGSMGQDIPEYCPNDRSAFLKAIYAEPYMPAVAKYALRRAMGLGAEGLYVSIPLVWPFFEKQRQSAQVFGHSSLPSSELIRKLPAAAYDHHTTEGKKCIAYFMKSCKPVHDFLEKFEHPNKLRLVGSALFCFEGGLIVDRTFGYPFAEEVVNHAYEGEWKHHRFQSKEAMYEFYGLVRDNLDELNAVRRKLLDAEHG